MSWESIIKQAGDQPWFYAPPTGMPDSEIAPFLAKNDKKFYQQLQSDAPKFEQEQVDAGFIPGAAKELGTMGSWVVADKAIGLGLKGLSKIPRFGKLLAPLAWAEQAYEKSRALPGITGAAWRAAKSPLSGEVLSGLAAGAKGTATQAGTGFLASRGVGGLFGPRMLAASAISAKPAEFAMGVGGRAGSAVNRAINGKEYADITRRAVVNAGANRIGSTYEMRVNPWQQFIAQMQNNPNARNALVGLLGGGLGGMALGAFTKHPWLGLAAGALGGGALMAMNPTWSNDTWKDINSFAGKLNYAPHLASSPVKTPTP